MNNQAIELANELGILLNKKGDVIVTAESCTGGGIAQALTEIPGSSAWFDRGFVTYSNAAKVQMLGVKLGTLESHGAVSAETAMEMALGALEHSQATHAIAVTGIAGPDGGSPDKPVGTVYIAWAAPNQSVKCKKHLFLGSRSEIRQQTVVEALRGLLSSV